MMKMAIFFNIVPEKSFSGIFNTFMNQWFVKKVKNVSV